MTDPICSIPYVIESVSEVLRAFLKLLLNDVAISDPVRFSVRNLEILKSWNIEILKS